MKRFLLIAVLLLSSLLAAAAFGQTAAVPITDVSQRASVTANGGAMVLTSGYRWSGASLGGTVLYNVHEKLSVFGGYDHGFPINNVDPHLNLWRAVGSLRVHPNAFLGFGYAWFDRHTSGGLAQILVTKQVLPRVAVSGVYAHVFTRITDSDFEYFRVFVNYHLLGKE